LVELIASVKVLEVDFESGREKKLEEDVAVEEPLFVYVNGRHLVTLLSSPSMKKELALGHLITEGLVDSLEAVKGVHVKGLKVSIELAKTLEYSHKTPEIIAPMVDTVGVVSQSFLKALENIREKLVVTKARLDISKIYDMACEFEEKSIVHKKTRGTHSAAIFKFNGELVSFAEDVGRHNAVDKVVGDALLKKANISESVLFSSGRQSAYMVLKAARAHIPIVVSIAHPLESGIKVAEKVGITLAQISGKNIRVYTHFERVKLKDF